MPIDLFLSSQFKDLLDDQSVEMLLQGITEGRIQIVASESTEYFEKITFLPNNGTRLSWEQIPSIRLHPPARLSGSTAHRGIHYGLQQKELLESLTSYLGIGQEMGILFEDHYSDCVLELSFDDFNKLDVEFLYTPGHKYFLSSEGRWLLNVTMEGDLYFTGRLANFSK